jgi:hypothetical protein
VAHDDTTTRLTFGARHESAEAVAGGLVGAGLQPGDRMLLPVTDRNAAHVAVAHVRIQRAGGIAVPVSPRSSGDENAAFRELVGARWCLTDVPEKCTNLPLDGLWAVDEPPRGTAPTPDGDALPADADILSTSGTTGRPLAGSRRPTAQVKDEPLASGWLVRQPGISDGHAPPGPLLVPASGRSSRPGLWPVHDSKWLREAGICPTPGTTRCSTSRWRSSRVCAPCSRCGP